MKSTSLVWEDLATLPAEAQREARKFIATLKERYKTPIPVRARKSGDLADEPFIGMWRDREDLEDGEEWVRSLRKTEWTDRLE